MLRLLLLTAMFWISVSTESSQNGPTDSGNFLEKRKRSEPRGYYGGLGYPYLDAAPKILNLYELSEISMCFEHNQASIFHKTIQRTEGEHISATKSFAEPLTILAGLAFIAYLIQAFHAVYFNHNHGLGGGILPPKGRNIISEATNQDKAFEFSD